MGEEGLTRALLLGAGLRKVIFEAGHLSLIWILTNQVSLLWISKLLNNMEAQSAWAELLKAWLALTIG